MFIFVQCFGGMYILNKNVTMKIRVFKPGILFNLLKLNPTAKYMY